MDKLPDPYDGMNKLTSDELTTIAKTTLNWGHADAVLGLALATAYNIHHEAAKDLIHQLEMSRKISLLNRLLNQGKIPEQAKPFLIEVEHAQKNYKSIRNLIAHGLLVASASEGGPSTFISLKGSKGELQELELALEQSKFVGLAANRVFFSVMGLPETLLPLPQRPPSQLPQ